MSGYGGCDDEALRASIRVEEAVALARSMIPRGTGTTHCIKCGDAIPAARRQAIPGTTFCVACQATSYDAMRHKFKEPWAT